MIVIVCLSRVVLCCRLATLVFVGTIRHDNKSFLEEEEEERKERLPDGESWDGLNLGTVDDEFAFGYP